MIAGKYYLLTRLNYYKASTMTFEETPWSVYVVGRSSEMDGKLLSKSWFSETKTYEYYIGRPDKVLVEISREIHAPVFCLSPAGNGVEGDVPILGNLGIPSIVPPEQMYQDLSYFVGNIMKEVPDIQPAGKPPMTDKEKVSSHGFDLKASFRHRKN